MAAKTQSLPKNPYSKGAGGDYSLDRPPLVDEINGPPGGNRRAKRPVQVQEVAI
jgi:hypothetical protein